MAAANGQDSDRQPRTPANSRRHGGTHSHALLAARNARLRPSRPRPIRALRSAVCADRLPRGRAALLCGHDHECVAATHSLRSCWTEWGTNRVSDQLSDYGLAAPRSRVHVHGPSSHSARDLDRAPDLLSRRRGRKSNSRCRVPGTCPKSTRQAVNEGQLRTPTSVTSKAIRRVAHRARCVFQAGHASSILVIALRPPAVASRLRSLRPPVRDRSSGPAEPLARTPGDCTQVATLTRRAQNTA
jgi:hypothetical protein